MSRPSVLRLLHFVGIATRRLIPIGFHEPPGALR